MCLAVMTSHGILDEQVFNVKTVNELGLFFAASQTLLSIQCSCITDLGFSSASSLWQCAPFHLLNLGNSIGMNVYNSPGHGM